MTNYQNDIMGMLQGETPKQKFEFLKELLKQKEKNFEPGANAKIHPKVEDSFFIKGDTVIVNAKFTGGYWGCKGRNGIEGLLHESEMELI